MIVALIFFLISAWVLAQTYLLYFISMKLLSLIKRPKSYQAFQETGSLPVISILMAAYNEELVIEDKIRSVFSTDYPLNNVEMWIGSDNSNDKTNQIIEKLSNEFPGLHFIPFASRQGKISIINQLYEKAKGEILMITDANVMLRKDTLFELVKFFKDKRIGLVDSHMKNTGIAKDGISGQEKTYISFEVAIKNLESKLFGTMIGPFGGCYAVRKELFAHVPENYLVDDFFVCLTVLKKGKYAINNLDALVFEDVSNSLREEFRRKVRIASGNFQNLVHFRSLLCTPWKPLSYCYLSHKVLRWIGPFAIIALFLSSLILAFYSKFFLMTFAFQLFIIILLFLDLLLTKINSHNIFLRSITHFYSMNLSLLIGFIKFIKGINSNVWTPTRRFQGQAEHHS
jgi:cellulose synthase/poly-beta-1,6-N-acetylglucosamine synthase-like glycosyltransferase